MKFISVKTGYLLLILIGVSVLSAWSMEEVPEEEEAQAVESAVVMPSKVKPLTELAIQPAAEKILSNVVLTVQGIHAAVSRFPLNFRIPLALALIKDARFPGTAVNKLRLAYHVSEDAGNQQIPQVDALFDEVIKNIDPCYFVHKPVALLLPGYEQNKFTLRDERLIKAILRKPGLKLPSKYLKQPMLSIRGMTNQTNGAISPDGSMFAWGMEDNTLCVWHIQDNKPVAVFKLPNSFEFDPPVAWSPNSQMLAVADGRGEIYIWNIRAQAQPQVRLQVQGMQPAFYQEFVQARALDESVYVEQYARNREKLSALERSFIDNLHLTNWVDEQQNIVMLCTVSQETKRATTWYIQRNTGVPARTHFTADEHAIYSMSFSPDGRF